MSDKFVELYKEKLKIEKQIEELWDHFFDERERLIRKLSEINTQLAKVA